MKAIINPKSSKFKVGSGFCLLLFLIGCSLSVTAQITNCANNNDDPPPYIPGSDPLISVNTIDVQAANPPSELCIGDSSDPDSDTNGCGTFRFVNLPMGNNDCPSYFCFTPKQGCGEALGNVCVWIEGIDADTWATVGTIDDSNGYTKICVASDPTISTFDVTVCRPGNGPVSVSGIEVYLPPEIGIQSSSEICAVDLPGSIDLTAHEPAGFEGGLWSSNDVSVSDPANVFIPTASDGTVFSFGYAYDASFQIPGSSDPASNVVIDVGCITRDTIDYVAKDVCCVCAVPTFTGASVFDLALCNPDLTDSDNNGIIDLLDATFGSVSASGPAGCTLIPITFADAAPSTSGCVTTVLRTYSVTTECGGFSATFEQQIQWTTNTEVPGFANCSGGVLTARPNAAGCNADESSASEILTAVGAATDNCGASLNLPVATLISLDTIAPVVTEVWEVTVVDDCGNTGVCEVTVNRNVLELMETTLIIGN